MNMEKEMKNLKEIESKAAELKIIEHRQQGILQYLRGEMERLSDQIAIVKSNIKLLQEQQVEIYKEISKVNTTEETTTEPIIKQDKQ